MTPCQHAKTCPRRMRDGDRPGGCSSVDQRTCSPMLVERRAVPRDETTMNDRIADRYLFTMFAQTQESA